MCVLVGTRVTYHSQPPRLLLLMSTSIIRLNLWMSQKEHELLTNYDT